MAATGIKEGEAALLAQLDPARMTADRSGLLFTSRKDLYVWLAKPRFCRGGAQFQPRRQARRLRARQRPLRLRHRPARRAAPDARRQRDGPQRQARLALPGGGLRPGELPRLLVEPGLGRAGLPAAGREGRAALDAGRRRAGLAGDRERALPARRRGEPQGAPGHRLGGAARGALGRPDEVRALRAADRRRHLVGQRARRLPGPGSRAELARARQREQQRDDAQDAAARGVQDVGQRQRPAEAPRRRQLPLVQRAQRLEAPVPLLRRMAAARPGDARRVGGARARRRRRAEGPGLFHRHASEPDREPGLPDQARRHGPAAPDAEARHAQRSLQPALPALHRHLERPVDAAAGAPARGRRQRAARGRREPRGRALRIRARATGAGQGQGARRLHAGRDRAQAARVRRQAPLPGLPARLRRPALPAGAQRMGRRRGHVRPAARRARHRRARSPRRPATSASARASSPTSRTALPGSSRSSGSTPRTSASAAGASAASSPATR